MSLKRILKSKHIYEIKKYITNNTEMTTSKQVWDSQTISCTARSTCTDCTSIIFFKKGRKTL